MLNLSIPSESFCNPTAAELKTTKKLLEHQERFVLWGRLFELRLDPNATMLFSLCEDLLAEGHVRFCTGDPRYPAISTNIFQEVPVGENV